MILSVIYYSSCANIQGISGGPEDKTPPMLTEQNSTPNYVTNFNEREINLSFNEWVRIENPSANISISPPTEFPPEYKLKGKRFTIRFDKRETLRVNTTYNVQFGECIRDITAGNIQRNIRYVFSTGSYLDSLSIHGKVIDAFTKKPKEKILVSLYKLLDDTAFQKIKPYYFSWTDTAGKFSMNNLSPGMYKLYALEDKNQNYYYDQTTEGFAFYPDTIQINSKDSLNYVLSLSVKSLPVNIKDKQLRPGQLNVYFNEKPFKVKLECDSSSSIQFVNLKDSVLLWNGSQEEISCILNYNSKKDTFKIPPVKERLKDSIRGIQLVQSLIKPGELPEFKMNYPILQIRKDSFQFLDSVSKITAIHMDSLDPRKFSIEGTYPQSKPARLLIQANAIQGLHQITNRRDTFTLRFMEKSSLSRLSMNLDGLQTGWAYIFQLLNGETVNVEFTFVATESNKKLFFRNLFPGKYRLRLIHDANKNEYWDPANFSNRTQAESIWYFDIPDLRADWDVDVSIKL